MELISPVIKCFCAAVLDPQMYKSKESSDDDGLDAVRQSCLFQYTNGQSSTTGRKRSSETYLRIDLGETIEYASIRKTIHRGYTLTKWTRVNLKDFDDNRTSYIDLAEFDHPRLHMERVACC